jgi:hydrogenase maturation protease
VSADLKEILLQKDKKILFVGIGNLLKRDDGVGVYITRGIKNSGHISALTVEVSIENYIGKINTLNPDILVLIDCVDMKSSPGTCRLIPVDNIQDLTFNTHNISLKKLSEFFVMPVYILGIQPEKVDFGEKLSYIVMKVADKIIQLINKQEVHYGY